LSVVLGALLWVNEAPWLWAPIWLIGKRSAVSVTTGGWEDLVPADASGSIGCWVLVLDATWVGVEDNLLSTTLGLVKVIVRDALAVIILNYFLFWFFIFFYCRFLL